MGNKKCKGAFLTNFQLSLLGGMIGCFMDSLASTFDEFQTTHATHIIKSLKWNKLLLSCVGIWPLKVYDPVFSFFFIYLVFHCTFTLADLANCWENIDDVIANISENMTITMTLVKITICRIRRPAIAQMLAIVEEDLDYENNESRENYAKMSYRYGIFAFITMTIATGVYYIDGIFTNIQIAIHNSSMGYQLPYKTRAVFDMTDLRFVVPFCLYEAMFVVTISFGYVGFDCLFTNLTVHLTTQFAILTCKVKNALNDPKGCRSGMKMLVLRHRRLIRLAETLEDNFNIIILQQLLGTTVHLCITGYHTMVGSTKAEIMKVIAFSSYGCSVMSTLFAYSYVGECLIEESTNFGNALYDYEWYNISPIDSKLIHICMMRTKKPQHLTSGKFCVLSLSIFTDIVKASMGYLSLLRSVREI